jgi:hypothetical protein
VIARSRVGHIDTPAGPLTRPAAVRTISVATPTSRTTLPVPSLARSLSCAPASLVPAAGCSWAELCRIDTVLIFALWVL